MQIFIQALSDALGPCLTPGAGFKAHRVWPGPNSCFFISSRCRAAACFPRLRRPHVLPGVFPCSPPPILFTEWRSDVHRVAALMSTRSAHKGHVAAWCKSHLKVSFPFFLFFFVFCSAWLIIFHHTSKLFMQGNKYEPGWWLDFLAEADCGLLFVF